MHEARPGRRCSLLALAWMTMVIAAAGHRRPAVDEDDEIARRRSFGYVVERNRRTIGSLFEGTTKGVGPADGNNNNTEDGWRSLWESGLFGDAGDAAAATTTDSRYIDRHRPAYKSNHGITAKKSLLKMPSPEIFQDSESLDDSDSNAPHVRVKRITNSLNLPSRTNGKSSPLYIDQGRVSQKMFKRFSLEETNPADEDESEYSNGLDEDNVDDTGEAFLNDELSKKRNHLEDIYPDVADVPKRKERISRAPEHPKGSNDIVEDLVRRKRDRERDENEESYADEDCIDDDRSAEYYYDDEEDVAEEQDASNARGAENQASRSDEYEEEDAGLVEGEQKLAKRTSAVIENDVGPKTNLENIQLSESNQNSKVKEEDNPRSPIKEERSAAVKEKPQVSSPAKKPDKHTQKKDKSRKKKPTSEKKITKEKTKSKPSHKKPKSHPHAKKDKKRAPPKATPSKSASNLNENNAKQSHYIETDHPSEKQFLPAKFNGAVITVRKTVPHSSNENVAKLEIYRQSDNTRTAEGKKKSAQGVRKNVAPSKDRSGAVETKDKFIGEVKDLLGKLIVKVDDLHSLVTEMRGARNGGLQLTDEKMTRSNFPVDSQRARQPLRPCSSLSSSSSSSSATWGPWTRWTSCSASCGRGTQTRSRRCLSGPSAENEERVCGVALECPPTKFLGIF